MLARCGCLIERFGGVAIKRGGRNRCGSRACWSVAGIDGCPGLPRQRKQRGRLRCGPYEQRGRGYFSTPLTDSESHDADSGASIVMSGDGIFGNVQWAAQFVAIAAGAYLLRIETTTPYPTDDAIFDYALQEQNQNARPEIRLVAADGSTVDSLDAYSTVLVGYPIWWYELPMPLYTFFEEYDLAGKNIGLFVVHGGSGMSGTVQDVEGLQPDAQVNENGLSINRRNVADQAEELANEWVAGLGLSEAQ